jgi:hypothetical protein
MGRTERIAALVELAAIERVQSQMAFAGRERLRALTAGSTAAAELTARSHSRGTSGA